MKENGAEGGDDSVNSVVSTVWIVSAAEAMRGGGTDEERGERMVHRGVAPILPPLPSSPPPLLPLTCATCCRLVRVYRVPTMVGWVLLSVLRAQKRVRRRGADQTQRRSDTEAGGSDE